jgi:hypothetical protein
VKPEAVKVLIKALYALGFLFFVMVIMMKNDQPSTPFLNEPQAARVTIERVAGSTLIGAYEQNEVAADQMYKGRKLLVQGRIGKIGKDVIDTPYLTLDEEENGFRGVQAFFSKSDIPELAQLRKGQIVEVVGTCDGLMMDVLLQHSVLQSKSQ